MILPFRPSSGISLKCASKVEVMPEPKILKTVFRYWTLLSFLILVENVGLSVALQENGLTEGPTVPLSILRPRVEKLPEQADKEITAEIHNKSLVMYY